MTENLAHDLTAMTLERPDRPALRIAEQVVSYAELEAATARLAGLLRDREVKPGDRVGIMLPNVPEFAIAYYGVLRAGVVVPMNVMLRRREIAFYLRDSSARLVLAWHTCAGSAPAWATSSRRPGCWVASTRRDPCPARARAHPCGQWHEHQKSRRPARRRSAPGRVS